MVGVFAPYVHVGTPVYLPSCSHYNYHKEITPAPMQSLPCNNMYISVAYGYDRVALVFN